MSRAGLCPPSDWQLALQRIMAASLYTSAAAAADGGDGDGDTSDHSQHLQAAHGAGPCVGPTPSPQLSVATRHGTLSAQQVVMCVHAFTQPGWVLRQELWERCYTQVGLLGLMACLLVG
jgi:hypothetical protein